MGEQSSPKVCGYKTMHRVGTTALSCPAEQRSAKVRSRRKTRRAALDRTTEGGCPHLARCKANRDYVLFTRRTIIVIALWAARAAPSCQPIM